jgi:hypothetical protein
VRLFSLLTSVLTGTSTKGIASGLRARWESFPHVIPAQAGIHYRAERDGVLPAALLSCTCDHAHYSDEVPE